MGCSQGKNSQRLREWLWSNSTHLPSEACGAHEVSSKSHQQVVVTRTVTRCTPTVVVGRKRASEDAMSLKAECASPRSNTAVGQLGKGSPLQSGESSPKADRSRALLEGAWAAEEVDFNKSLTQKLLLLENPGVDRGAAPKSDDPDEMSSTRPTSTNSSDAITNTAQRGQLDLTPTGFSSNYLTCI